jgi:hypothetical protein
MGKLKLWSGNPNIREYPEGASQTFAEGDLVFFSSGSVVIATDGDDVVGVAAAAASGTTGAMVPIQVVTPEQVWSVYTAGATPAVATHQGNDYDFSVFTTALQVITLGSAGTDVIIQALDPRDTPATGTRVLVRFNPDSCWAIKGS